MTAFPVDGEPSCPSDPQRSARHGLRSRLQQRRADRRARREFDAVVGAWTRGTSLPSRARAVRDAERAS